MDRIEGAVDPDVVVLDAPATLGFLRVVCAAVVAACGLHPSASPEFAHDLELAVQEIGTNVVRHAYRGAPGHRLRVEIVPESVAVTVIVFDDGSPFDPASAPAAGVGEPRVHGYGLALARRLVDVLTYERVDGRNRWRLRKLYASPSAPDPEPL